MRCVPKLSVCGMDTLICFSSFAAGGLEFSDFPAPHTEFVNAPLTELRSWKIIFFFYKIMGKQWKFCCFEYGARDKCVIHGTEVFFLGKAGRFRLSDWSYSCHLRYPSVWKNIVKNVFFSPHVHACITTAIVFVLNLVGINLFDTCIVSNTLGILVIDL